MIPKLFTSCPPIPCSRSPPWSQEQGCGSKTGDADSGKGAKAWATDWDGGRPAARGRSLQLWLGRQPARTPDVGPAAMVEGISPGMGLTARTLGAGLTARIPRHRPGAELSNAPSPPPLGVGPGPSRTPRNVIPHPPSPTRGHAPRLQTSALMLRHCGLYERECTAPLFSVPPPKQQN